MLAVFWTVMAAAGLITELIFSGAGLIPTRRPIQIVPEHLTWNYTTILNIIFGVIFAVLYSCTGTGASSAAAMGTRSTRSAACR